jgi:hypothetical protein
MQGFAMTTKALGILAGLAFAAMYWATPANSALLIYDATLTADGESNSTGTGVAIVTIDSVLDTMRVQVTFSGLTSGTTASHIHCCTAMPGVPPVGVATTTPSFTGFVNGVTFGNYDHTFDMTLATSFNPAFVTAHGSVSGAFDALLAGLAADEAYLNIHTTNFPNGEILGFLVLPLPGTLPLFATGLVGLGLLGWRRTRKAQAI